MIKSYFSSNTLSKEISLLCPVRILVLISCAALAGCNTVDEVPFDRTYPIILTNDMGTHDVFQAEFALALASRGDIHLLGIVAEKLWRGEKISNDFENDAYADLCEMAERSGMKNIPPVKLGFLFGKTWTLDRPDNGLIEDTAPIETPGAAFILEKVLNNPTGKPVVIATGGQVTSIASAYLMAARKGDAKAFTEGVIIAGNLINPKKSGVPIGYFNFYTDPWAGYIVLKRLVNVVAVHSDKMTGTAERPQMRESMPDSELARFMLDKDLTNEWLPGNWVADADGLYLALFPKKGLFFGSGKRMSVTDNWMQKWDTPWFPTGMVESPVIRNDSRGNIIVVYPDWCSRKVRNAFLEAVSDSKTYLGVVVQQSPFHGRPALLNGRLEVEAFDLGQEGIAYHDEAFSESKPYSAAKLRQLERPDLEPSTDPRGGDLQLAYLGSSEWLEYTVAAPESGLYNVNARVSSVAEGHFLLEFRHPETDLVVKKSDPVVVPPTGGFDRWLDVPVHGVELNAGTYVMRFVHTGELARFEVEDLKCEATEPLETVYDIKASKKRGHRMKASIQGASVNYLVPTSRGWFRVIVGYRAGEDQGWMQLKIEDTLQRNPSGRKYILDQYIWRPEWRTFEFGIVEFDSEGTRTFTVEVPEKNKLSSGYNLVLDYLELQPEGPFKINYFDFIPPSGEKSQ